VAAYRAADLARDLMRAGCTVRVCLTDSAQKFVTPNLFEALTGQPALIDTFEEPEPGRMAHIDWARWASLILVAPATASTLARLAHGIGDDMLTTIALASTAPLILAPAMNPQMYASETNQQALTLLSQRAVSIVQPQEGDVACGEHGQGKLATNAAIVEEALTVLGASRKLEGKKVLVTSGPTEEPIDSVRFLTNRSSGKMGAAVARAALLMGAEVAVVAGPSSVRYPLQAEVVSVRTAEEMLEASRRLAPGRDLIVGAAAVADYRPADPSLTKIRRSEEPLVLKLLPNPDVIATLAQQNPGVRVVGFAAEPSGDLEEVKAKLSRKGLYAIAANDVSRSEIGFESDRNELWLVKKNGEPVTSGLKSKLACALWLLDQVS